MAMTKNKKSCCIHFAKWFRSHWVNITHVVGITLFAMLLAWIILNNLTAMSVFSFIEDSSDIEMFDIYQSMEESKAIHQLSNDITIVSIDDSSREEVIDVINIISEYEPAAIGLDIFFQVPEADNSLLLSALTDNPNIVCASKFERDETGDTFHHIQQSFFEDEIDVTYGYVNLNASSCRDVIRDFVPFVITNNGDTLLSLPAQLAKLCAPNKYRKLLRRGNDVETITFENIEYPIIPIQDVLSGGASESQLKNKIVLIGDLHDQNDFHLSPLHEPIPGIMLHAYALQTILSGNYIDSTPQWLNWLIAILLCVLFTIFNLLAKNQMSNIGGLFLRIVQFAMMYILLLIGATYFAHHHSYLDFSPAILMIGFGAVAFDVWFGTYAAYNVIKNKIIKR